MVAALKAATGDEKKPLALARGPHLSVVDSLNAMARSIYSRQSSGR
jgi:hypothetical protein